MICMKCKCDVQKKNKNKQKKKLIRWLGSTHQNKRSHIHAVEARLI